MNTEGYLISGQVIEKTTRLGFRDFVFDSSDLSNNRCWVSQADEVPEVDRDWGGTLLSAGLGALSRERSN